MPEKIQTSIYKIKQSLEISYQNIVEELENKAFAQQEIREDLSERYTITLFYKNLSTISNWKDFIETVAQPNQAILNRRVRGSRESFILFLLNNESNSIYAIAGGSGYASLAKFIDAEFGLNILSRLLNRESKSLRSTTEKSFFGGILGQIKYFRNDYNLIENDSFGNIYKELQSRLTSRQIAEQFNIPQNNEDLNYMCIAKDSFTIKRAIDFNELLHIVDNCEFLLTQPTVVTLNSYKKLTSADSDTIDNLDNQIIDKIYMLYQNNEYLDIDICHKNFEKYLSADKYILSIKHNNNTQEIEMDHPLGILEVVQAIKDIYPDLPPNNFKKIINNSHLESYIGNDSITIDPLRNHFNIETQYEERTYFLFNREWYLVGTAFLDKINERCHYYITNNKLNDNTLETWTADERDENQYNAKYLNRQGFMVFDKITPKNIEMCDFLKYDDRTLQFFHVKSGFDHSMRDLCYQVFISARLINEDLKNGYNYIRQMYNTIINYHHDDAYRLRVREQIHTMTEDEFVSIFREKNIVFVLAVKDTANNREIQDINRYESNIAKFAIQDLFTKMKDMGVVLKIYQIQ